jgi:hypothetical protein
MIITFGTKTGRLNSNGDCFRSYAPTRADSSRRGGRLKCDL